jgi:NAD-dependent SIR2 family protein deacetylase
MLDEGIEFIANLEIFRSCPKPGSPKNFLMRRSMLSKLKGPGIRPELRAELHGNLTKLRCGRRGKTYEKSSGKTTCPCGGVLTSSVVDFGQSLPEKDISLSYKHSRKSDLFVVVGSSLVVTPAADMPKGGSPCRHQTRHYQCGG